MFYSATLLNELFYAISIEIVTYSSFSIKPKAQFILVNNTRLLGHKYLKITDNPTAEILVFIIKEHINELTSNYLSSSGFISSVV